MKLDEYQQTALSTAICPHDRDIPYLALALCGEAGELANKVKKVIRDQGGAFYSPAIRELGMELGDILWYTAVLADKLDYKLSEIARNNNKKISGRLERGTLHGSGDER